MISWIQRNFQQHMRTIFMILLALIIVSFVFTIGAPGIGSGDRNAVRRPFYGVNLAAQDDMTRLLNDAALSVSLQMGYMGLESSQLQQYALQRHTGLHLADQLHVPNPTDAEKVDFLKTMRAFAGENGEFDNKRYTDFRTSLKANVRSNEGMINRVLSDDWRNERVQKLLGGPGYVLPGDVKQQLARTDSTWTLAVATADYANFNPELKPTEAEITKYFGDNAARYEIPPSVRAEYIEFPAASFISQVTVTEAETKAFYDSNPARFPKPAPATPLDPKLTVPAADPAADFAAVRPQVEAALRLDRAQRLALKAAADFSLALYEGKVAADSPAFTELASRNKVAPKPLAPFTREKGPAELGGNVQLAAEAFKLGQPPLSYYSDALPTANGAVVLLWKETLPARAPAFAEVRERVAADYTDNEKRKRFVELGKTLRTQVESRLKTGEAFDKAVSSAGSPLKLDTKTLAPFTLRQPPQDIDYPVLGALENLEKGQVSEMIGTNDKGYVVYVVDKKTPDFSEGNPQFAATRTQLAGYIARLNANTYLSEMVAQELKRSEPVAR